MDFDVKKNFPRKKGFGETALSIPDMQTEIARLTAERDAAFAAGVEVAAVILNDDATTLDAGAARFRGGSNPHHERADKAHLLRAYRDAIRALATTDQRAAFDKLVAERVAAELAKRGEPVAWPSAYRHVATFTSGSACVQVCPICDIAGCQHIRAQNTHPAPASVGVTVKPLEWDEWNTGFSHHTWNQLNALRSAKCALGTFFIGRKYKPGIGYLDDWWVQSPLTADLLGPFKTDLIATTAAQADYERRILAALSPTAEQEGGAV